MHKTPAKRWASMALLAAIALAPQNLMAARKGGGGGGGGGADDASVTDEQVVASMKKGIDFLLAQKKVDNWDIGTWKHGSGEAGGETGLVLYALLHAGESLQDQPEYQAKLNWRGKELSPAVAWLEKNMAKDTYVAGFEACALTLLPRRADQKPGEGPEAALDACKFYMLLGMGADGGYTYTTGAKGEDLIAELHTAWDAYYKGKSGAAKKSLDGFVKKYLNTSFGGPLMAMQMLVNEAARQGEGQSGGGGAL